MKLKPCPFCGREAHYVENYMTRSYVECSGNYQGKCAVKMFSYGFGKDTVDCRDAWNRRDASVESLDADARRIDEINEINILAPTTRR